MNKETLCECGHQRSEHNLNQYRDMKSLVCMHIDKDGEGNVFKVCPCEHFRKERTR